MKKEILAYKFLIMWIIAFAQSCYVFMLDREYDQDNMTYLWCGLAVFVFVWGVGIVWKLTDDI